MTETENSNGGAAEVATQEVAPEVVSKVIRQVEYYFGDINLTKDKFLKEQIKEDDGWVTLETMLKFNRLKQITEDSKVIADALRGAPNGLIEVNEEGSKIRRDPSKPLPGDTKERRDEISSRSVYAKRFPLDSKLDDLMGFFEGYGKVENIFMKRDFHKKTFKGSVFVTYLSKDDAEKFLKEEGTKYKEQDLESKLYKTQYYSHKFEQKKKGREKNEGSKEEAEETPEDEEEKVKQQMTKNSVLHLKGMDPETSREEIKSLFEKHTQVGWVDFDKGVTEGYLRLREPDSATSTLEKLKAAGDGSVVIKEKTLEVRVVEGDEELEYWKKMFKDIAAKNKDKKRDRRQGGGRFQRGGRRGGRGGRGGGFHGKRKFDRNAERDNSEPRAKAVKGDD